MTHTITCTYCQKIVTYENVNESLVDILEKRKVNYICDDCEKAEEMKDKEKTIKSKVKNIFGLRFENADLNHLDYSAINNSYVAIYREAVNELQHLRSTIICLLGTHGTGKTYLAAGLYRHCLETRKRCFYIDNAKDFIDRYKSFFWGSQREKYEIENDVEMYKRCDVLIIEEISKIKSKEDDSVILFKIIDYRYNNLLPTVLIGNVLYDKSTPDKKSKGADNFRALLGASLTDRILAKDNKIYYFYSESMR